MIITMTKKGAFYFMKKRILILFLSLTVVIGLLTILPVHNESDIYNNVLRLHVIANSDSDADQSLKLLVRDSILIDAKELLQDVSTIKDAEQIIAQSSERLQNTAEQTIRENGYDYPVEVTLGTEEYPTKNYESCAFPSGKYVSLQVKIGEATGQNWWCVLYPPLCLSAATDQNAFAEVGLTDGQYQIITDSKNPKYKLRFKILESFSEIVK